MFSGDNGVDLLIEDQLLRHNDLLTSAARHSAAVTADVGAEPTALPSAPRAPDPTLSASVEPPAAPLPSPVVSAEPPAQAVPAPSPQVAATTVAQGAAQPPPAPSSLPAAPGDAFLGTTHTAPGPPTAMSADSPGKDATTRQGTAPASPTLSPEEEDDIRNVIGELAALAAW